MRQMQATRMAGRALLLLLALGLAACGARGKPEPPPGAPAQPPDRDIVLDRLVR